MISASFTSRFLGVFATLTLCAHALDFYVSPQGEDANQGTKESPLSFEAALKKASALLKKESIPEGGLTIHVLGGRYHFAQPFKLGPEFKGTKERPIIIQAHANDEVIFDGAVPIPTKSFAPVTDPQERARLASSAADHIIATTITRPDLLKKLRRDLMMNLRINGTSYLPSVFPNSGYTKLKSRPVVKEVVPPGIPDHQVNYGIRAGTGPHQEPGKAHAWRGSLKEPRGAQVGFSDQAETMAGTWAQWEQELKRNNRRNSIIGFTEANWLLSSQPIYAASSARNCIHLSRALRYGWNWKAKDKPCRVFGMLCELDHPGEWHFDPLTNRLFLYPPAPTNAETSISLPLAHGLITLNRTSHVSLIGLSAENIGGGNVYHIHKGQHNLIASCTIRDSMATGIQIGGTHNTVRGCDLIDLNKHISLHGGRRSATEITPGHNLVTNCHIYQKNVRHQKINIHLSGVGNAFTNNLVHNSIGQAMTIRGNDHLIELNEFFNIGFEEGDGGAIYSGGDLTGYGNVYRHNFFHHLMHVPGKVARAGIHLDDHQAGSTCIGNLFYKSAEKGIFMFGGAGHTLRDNVLLAGSMGIYNTGTTGKRDHARQLQITADPNSSGKNSKEDYVGRAKKVVGSDGWNHTPWNKYSIFRKVMNDNGEFGRLWPIHCQVDNNIYYGNTRYNQTTWAKAHEQVMAKVSIRNDRTITPADFVNYNHLDLRFKTAGWPDIPFAKIGLQLDQYRRDIPDKKNYRVKIKEFFKGIGSMPGTRKQIDTAKVVETGPILRRSGS